MKRIIIILFPIALAFLGCSAGNQVAYTTPSGQELTKKQVKQIQRDQRRTARKAANARAFIEAQEAINDQNWVLRANTVYTRRGRAIPVTENVNFIQFKENTVYVQLAFNGISGSNGIGGVTLEGTPSDIEYNTDRNGNIIYTFSVNGLSLSADITITLTKNSNYASGTVYPKLSGNNVTFSGELVPTSQADIFRSGFIKYPR